MSTEIQSDSTEHVESPAGTPEDAYLKLECRPERIIAAAYERLPFPHLSPHQELAFDLGVTAVNGDVTLTGVVVKAYRDHQLLLEQRWPAAVIRRHVGEEDLAIESGTGLALRAVHLMLHGHANITHIDVVVVGKRSSDGATLQSKLEAPVVYHAQQTDLHFPLAGAWWTIQASDWSDMHKQEVFSQTYALDFVKLGPDNQFFGNDGRRLEDHYSWEQPVYAAAGGKVAYVCFDMPDTPPGQTPDQRIFRGDPRRLLGNAVAISHANGEFSYFAHLQQASIQVSEGQMIRRGAQIGRVGNSGQSAGPHLHFHLMEGPNCFIDQGLPVLFSNFAVGGQFFTELTTIPTRMIVTGPVRHTT